MRRSLTHAVVIPIILVILVRPGTPAWAASDGSGSSPFATAVVGYDPGTGAVAGYDDPLTTLGPPARLTSFGVVSPFNPAFQPDQIVSIGPGGFLVVSFEQPVIDDPANPFGIDLLVFGNAGFIDSAGVVGGIFSDGGQIEVSPDGENWTPIPGIEAEGLFPTLGYLDSGPYDRDPGQVESCFTRPVNPSVGLDELLGLEFAQLLALYGGSGGGTGVDLGSLGLEAISFVRISTPLDAIANVEIDAFSDVAPSVPGDANGDGRVDVLDLIAVISDWGAAGGGSMADLNGDGAVDVGDLVIVIVNWSQEPQP